MAEQVASYSVFPNDGVRVTPHMVSRVSNADGVPLWEDRPEVTQVIDQQTARTMMTLLKGVTQHGTGAAAAALNHPVGGKTGTTSDYTDAWFLGFTPSVTCGVWVGYDSREPLGEKETGAKAALPIWMTFMRVAIVGKPDEQFPGDEEKSVTGNAVAGAGSATAPGKPGTDAAPAAKTTAHAGLEPQPAEKKQSAAAHSAGAAFVAGCFRGWQESRERQPRILRSPPPN